MLKVDGISTGYGPIQVLYEVSLEVRAGEVLCLLGRNRAGKTTALPAIMGLLPLIARRVSLDGRVTLQRPPH